MNRLPIAARAALMATIALGLAAALRFLLVERPELTWACQSLAPPWWCPLRLAAIEVVRFGLFGFMALVAGVLAIWRGLFFALFAVVCGAAGLILYVPEPAAGGLLLGALAIVCR